MPLLPDCNETKQNTKTPHNHRNYQIPLSPGQITDHCFFYYDNLNPIFFILPPRLEIIKVCVTKLTSFLDKSESRTDSSFLNPSKKSPRIR